MSFWDAHSDRDWYDECYGPYPDTVERECCVCRTLFTMTVAGDYVAHVVCPKCDVEQEREQPTKRGAV